MTDTDTERDPSVVRWRDGRNVEEFERGADTHLPRSVAVRPTGRVEDVATHPTRR